MACVLCCHIGGHTAVPICQSTPSLGLGVLYPKARTEGHTRKQCVYCQSQAFTLFAQGSFGFLVYVLALLARLARGDRPHASGQRADVIHPAACLATCLCCQPLACLGALRGLVLACQAMKLERALSVTEAAWPPAVCWRLAASTKHA